MLATIETCAKAADLLDQAAPVRSKVSDVISREDQRRIPVRLEMSVVPVALVIELIFVAVDDVGFRMAENLTRYPEQRMRSQLVVGIRMDTLGSPLIR